MMSKYGDTNIFDVSSLKNNFDKFGFIGEVYHRKYKNPLYLIMRDDASKYKQLVDNVYEELLRDNEADILECSVYTEIVSLIRTYKDSGQIDPSIMYYTNEQLESLDSIEELKDINKVSYDNAIYKPRFSHYYFKYISESEPFRDKLQESVIYVSTCGLNLKDIDEKGNLDINIDNEILINLIKKRVRYAIFDLYQPSLIGDYK